MRERQPVARSTHPDFQKIKRGSRRPWGERQITQEVVEGIEVLGALLTPLRGERDSRTIAQRLMFAFGSLSGVLRAPQPRLAEHADPGAAELLGRVHATCRMLVCERIKARPIIGSWRALEEYLLLSLRHLATEALMILFLDATNGLIVDELFCQGTEDHVLTYPREIAKRCLQLDASAIIMVHNHPSGDAKPSRLDIDMTRQVIAALAPLGIAVHDHAIVGRNDVVSLRAQRLL